MLRTPIFKCLHRCLPIGAIVLLVLAFTMGSSGTQPAQASTATRISNGWMPLAGSLRDPQTNSNIHLNGLAHIVARWKSVSASESQLDIQVNLPAAGVTVTADTGLSYIASSAGQPSVFYPVDPVYPTDPVYPVDPIRVIVPSFQLMAVGSDGELPPNPIVPPNPVKPFGLQLDLVFDAAGVLDFDASTVQVIELRTEE